MAYRFYLENYGFRDVTIILISFSSIILNSTFSKLSCMQQEFLISVLTIISTIFCLAHLKKHLLGFNRVALIKIEEFRLSLTWHITTFTFWFIFFRNFEISGTIHFEEAYILGCRSLWFFHWIFSPFLCSEILKHFPVTEVYFEILQFHFVFNF